MLNERKLTPDELKKREQIIQNMLNNKQEIVKRYGKEAEKMIYGRATKMVQKQSEKQMENTKLKEMIKAALMGPVSEFQDIEVGADRYEAEKDLGQASAMMSELESLLKGFDWYYYMSDDPRVYNRWGATDNQISKLERELTAMGYGEDVKTLHNQYAPDDRHKMKEGKKEDVDGDGDIDSKDYLAKRDAAIKKAKGEMKGDMGRKPKALTSLVRNSVNMFGSYNVGMICTNHTYASQDMFDPDDKISGGQGFIYASSIVVAMRKLKLKTDADGNKTTTVNGIRAACKIMKTRYAKPFESVQVEIPYETGMNPYSGLTDLFEARGLLKKEGNSLVYTTADGEIIKQFRKAWERNESGSLDTVMADIIKNGESAPIVITNNEEVETEITE